MEWIDKVMALWEQFCKKTEPIVARIQQFFGEVKRVWAIVWDFVRRMKKVVLAAPIAFFALVIGIYNLARLPAIVGVFLQESGEYLYQIPKEVAVLSPIALTAICLLLMFCSKRTLTPWLVSLFSLAVPIVILITNVLPS